MELFSREYGEGPPLILLHGIFGISDNWVTVGKRIAGLGYHVIIPDQRNHGRSPHSPAFNYYALVDDLTEFVDAHGIESPILMGHSMGGKVAMRYILENPDMVSGLIAVDVSLRTYVVHHQHRELIDAMKSADLGRARSRSDVEAQLKERIKSERIRLFLMKNLFWKDHDRLGWRLNLRALEENLESMYDGVFYSTQYRGPALFIKGGNSDYISEDDKPDILEKFPRARIETIPGATHWVHADAPEAFFSLVSDFLSD